MKILKQHLWLATSFLVVAAVFAGCSLNFWDKKAEEEKEGSKDTESKTEETTKPEEKKAEESQPSGDISYSTPKEKDIWTQKLKKTFLQAFKATSQYAKDVKTFEDAQKLGKYSFFEVGTITKEKYKGEKLLVLIIPCDGMCFANDTYRFAYNEETKALTLLKKHSSNNEYSLPLISQISTKTDSTTNLENLDPPEKILMPGTDKYAELDSKDDSDILEFDEYTDPKSNYSKEYIDKDSGIKIYYDLVSPKDNTSPGCFSVVLQDGTVSVYSFKPEFGKAITDKYSMTAGGCGLTGSCYLLPPNAKDSDFVKSLNTSGKMDFYVPKNPKTDPTTLENYERFKVQQQWKVEENPKLKIPSIDEFVQGEPLLYWKDPMGRWSSLINNDIKPAAECGKPVIYLYPEKTLDVSVEVGIERLTKTIPEYNNGWKVSAEPNGTLYNYADKLVYPYLFWEGQSKGILNATKGFSVQRNDLEKFLTNSLDSLGLNSTEKKDFMDFWLSKMLANKEDYFFISFVGTRDFNKVAPLKISPAPDTLIRVFMYYMPIDMPMRTEKQDLKAIKRNGFTVVEWGGTSSVPWLE